LDQVFVKYILLLLYQLITIIFYPHLKPSSLHCSLVRTEKLRSKQVQLLEPAKTLLIAWQTDWSRARHFNTMAILQPHYQDRWLWESCEHQDTYSNGLRETR